MLKNPSTCHPEEPKAVLSETKEGSLQFPQIETAEILRFAQNDRAQQFSQHPATIFIGFLQPCKCLVFFVKQLAPRRRGAKKREAEALAFFADFAHFAALRETGLPRAC